MGDIYELTNMMYKDCIKIITERPLQTGLLHFYTLALRYTGGWIFGAGLANAPRIFLWRICLLLMLNGVVGAE